MRYSGTLGVKGDLVETSPGIWEQPITELPILGEVISVPMRWSSGELQQENLRLNDRISFIVPEDLKNKFSKIAYIVYEGERWTITKLDYRPPRLILTLGGVYDERG